MFCSTEIFLAAMPDLNSATTNTIIHIQYNKYACPCLISEK